MLAGGYRGTGGDGQLCREIAWDADRQHIGAQLAIDVAMKCARL